MSRIAYDPVKDRLASFIRRSGWLRKGFYGLLNIWLLRSWHVRRELRRLYNRYYAGRREWTVFDAGFGFGQYDAYMLRRFSNLKLQAVEVKADYLKDCRHYFAPQIESGRASFWQEDLLDLSYEQRWDTAVCVDVLEHIDDDVQVMGNLARGLKSGGRLLVHTPSDLAGEDAGEQDSFVDEHARAGYCKQEMGRKLSQAGLQVETMRYTYGRFGHAGWVVMMKWPMLLLTRLGMGALALLPLYYLPALPAGLLLHRMDLAVENPSGTGLLVVARKP